jgi:recombination protein RecT
MTNINNSLTNKTEKPRFSVAIQSEQYQQMIHNTLKDKKRSSNYIAGIMSAVAVNPMLQECEASTVLSASLLGESLGLSHSPSMGQYFMVPYNDNKTGKKNAVFQLG